MSEEKQPYIGTFTSFAGCDALVSFNGVAVGELSEVKWKKKLGSYLSPSIEGTIKATVFDRDPIKEYEGKTFDILTQYMNEYGQKRLEFIYQAHLETKAGGVSIDQLVSEVGYTFRATDVTDVPWLDTHKEMMEYMLENISSPHTDKKMNAKAYAHFLSFGMSIGRFKIMEKEEYLRLSEFEKQTSEIKVDATKLAQQIVNQISKKGGGFE